jgi:pimeloyl-ACP methyl ester carboxylesterase
MPVMQLGDAELYFEEFGSGDEVIVSAQMHFDPDGYTRLLAERNPGFRIYQITLRGYGNSTHIYEDLGPRLLHIWADDVYRFSRKLGLERFIYSGVSHGAGVGWRLALDHPEALKAFISIVGAPHDRTGGDSSEARRRTQEGADDPKAFAESLRERPLLYAVPTKDPRRLERRRLAQERAIARFASMKPEELRLNQRKPFPEAKTNEELAAVLARVSVPTLLLCGVQDDIISAEMSLLAARSVPGAKAVFYQDHSHTLPGEAPERICMEIELFVRELNEGWIYLENPMMRGQET